MVNCMGTPQEKRVNLPEALNLGRIHAERFEARYVDRTDVVVVSLALQAGHFTLVDLKAA